MSKVRTVDLQRDLGDVLRMSASFCASIGQQFDAESMTQTLETMSASDDSILLIWGSQAMAAATSAPTFFNYNQITAVELGWWVDKPARGRGAGKSLLLALEDWARSIGAKRLSMMSMEMLGPEVPRMYEAHGYMKAETTFCKEF